MPPASKQQFLTAVEKTHSRQSHTAPDPADADPLNMCEGDALMASTLEKSLADRITTGCYDGGHLMYRDEQTRLQLSRDVTLFMRDSMEQSQ